MINLKDELVNFKPVLSVEEVEDAVRSDEIRDVMDLLQHLAKQISSGKE